jgi:NADH-quinone oxidoreductase subunit M
VLGAIGVILSAAYMLPMFQKVFLGEATADSNKNLIDLNAREIVVSAAFAVLIIWMGLAPNSFLKLSQESVAKVIERVQASSSLSEK